MKKIWILIGLALLAIAGFITVRETQKPQTQESRAAVKNAKIFLLPTQQNITGEGTVQVWVTSDAPVVFARIDLTFDKALLKLSQAITLTNATLGTTVALTSPTDANASGKITIVVAKNPASSAGAPTGTFQIANIKVIPNTTQQNSSTSMDVDTTSSQLVAEDSSEFTLTKGVASLVVNPTASSGTITPTRTPTPTQIRTGTPTPTPTSVPGQQTITLRLKLAGVTDGAAEGAKVAVKFSKRDGTITQLSSPLTLTHVGGGVYSATAIITNPFPAGAELRIKIKGEKHVSVQFCRQSGQTGPCADTQYITIPSPAPASSTFDFTGIPLPPGDLAVQDGQANGADLDKLTPLMSKICTDLTAGEKLIGDVDYNGCVNVRDVFLILQTLETRYDE